MILRINYDRYKFYSDSKKLLLFGLLNDKPFVYLIVIFIINVIVYTINVFLGYEIFPREIKFITLTLGTGLLGMLLYTAFDFIFKLRKIKKALNFLPKNEEQIILNKNFIELSWNGQTLTYKWNSFKKVIHIKDTIYLIPKEKSPFIRFSKKEVKDFNFEEISTFLKAMVG